MAGSQLRQQLELELELYGGSDRGSSGLDDQLPWLQGEGVVRSTSFSAKIRGFEGREAMKRQSSAEERTK